MIETKSTKPCRIAELELQADKVKWETKPIVVVDLESGVA